MSGIEVIQVLEGHNSDINSCDFNGNYLATGSGDKTIKVWHQNSKGIYEEVAYSPLLYHSYSVNCIRFSPFGKFLVSASTDGKIILWNIENGEIVAQLQHLSRCPIRTCSFSPNSGVLATGGDDMTVYLWELATKSIIRVLDGHEAMITASAFTPDSSFIVTGSTSGYLMIYDARYGHGKSLLYTEAHDLGVLGCDFSPHYEVISENGFLKGNYTLATCGNDDFVKIWLVKTGASKDISLALVLNGHSASVMSCRFSSDGNLLASTSGDNTVIIWNSNSGRKLCRLEKHSRYVTCCAFLNNVLLATGSNDKTVVIWGLDTENFINPVVETLEFVNDMTLGGAESGNNFLNWSVQDVSAWLLSLKLPEMIDIFKRHSIDGKELLYLTHDTLQRIMKIDSLGRRNKILRGIQYLKNPQWKNILPETDDNVVPQEFLCPITHEIMREPVVACDGYSYEKEAISTWFEMGNLKSPLTNEELTHTNLIPNRTLMTLISKYKT